MACVNSTAASYNSTRYSVELAAVPITTWLREQIGIAQDGVHDSQFMALKLAFFPIVKISVYNRPKAVGMVGSFGYYFSI